jgi:gamma-glutamyltranspeptidase / glutathione hydrolase
MDPFEPRIDGRRSPVLGTAGSVASSQPLASSAGVAILARGGTAADAAVATAAALNVTEPTSTGIGGDCFALYYEAASGRVTALNGSGRSPAALTLDLLRRQGHGAVLPDFHAHTVTVPGACAGWCDLVARHGRLSMGDVLGPAIEIAERGFPVAPLTAHYWAAGVTGQLGRSAAGQELLLSGRAPRAGEIFRNPGLARTFRRVVEGGADAFYRGEIAEAIAKTVREHGGVLAESDLAEHRSSWETPLSVRYRGMRVWECPPNGQGLVVLLALRILDGLDLASLDPLGAARLHLAIEALRLAFADARAHVCDPEHARVPVEELLSDAYIAGRRALISRERAQPRVSPGLRAASDTVYLCAVDREGNACSFINSNYQGFGTGLVPAGFGFTLQNRGAGFDLEPGHPNVVAPRKRPYHTIIPGLLTHEDGRLFGPFGVMGAFMQPQGHVQVVSGLIDDGLDPQAALDRPRFCLEDGDPAGRIAVEPEIPAATLGELERLGHTLVARSGWRRSVFGRGQVIRRGGDGVLWAGSEPRADGCAIALYG